MVRVLVMMAQWRMRLKGWLTVLSSQRLIESVLNCESENCSIRCTVKPVAQRSLHLHSSWVNWHQDLGLLWTMWEQVRLNLPIGGDTCLFVEVLVPVEDILLNPQQHNTLCTVLSPHACCIWQVTTDSIVQNKFWVQ